MVLLSGADCVRALEAAGFCAQHRGPGITTLARGGRVVVVPAVAALTPDLLRAVLRSAGLTLSALQAAALQAQARQALTMRIDDVDAAPTTSSRWGVALRPGPGHS